MAKYSILVLDVRDGALPELDKLGRDKNKALSDGYVIYIYRGTGSGKVYIGQTKNFKSRHDQHYNGKEEKFNTADFDQVMVIFSSYFDRSALDDVESQLITYFTADRSENTGQTIAFDSKEVINRTGGNKVSAYLNREKIASEVILPLWEEKLYPMGWVKTKTLDMLRTKALVKYSPIKVLTAEQRTLINEIFQNPDKNYVINGDAGTGKTVLLTHLVARLLQDREDVRIGVIIQPNWESTGADIFKVFGMSSTRLTITTSTKFIKANEKYDVIIVDEAHKLSRRYGKQHPSFNEVYDIDGFADCTSHLEILRRMGSQVILLYDVLQAIRPANITREMFQNLTDGYERRFLTTQFRIQTPEGKSYTSDDYINGIKYLLYKDTGLLDTGYTRFDPDFSRDLFRDNTPDAYFGYFTEHPLHQLIDWIEEDNNFNPEHVNRVLAGLVEPWKQSDGKDAGVKHWHEDDISRRWNSTQENWINSRDEDAREQIGSVFAVQGIDLNKVGVLIGNDLAVDENGRLYAEPANFHNTNGTFTQEEMEMQENRDEFTLFVLNIYYVLLTRGIDGIRLGFWKNDAFRVYMEKTLDICLQGN